MRRASWAFCRSRHKYSQKVGTVQSVFVAGLAVDVEMPFFKWERGPFLFLAKLVLPKGPSELHVAAQEVLLPRH
jgi:hypothetical protein